MPYPSGGFLLTRSVTVYAIGTESGMTDSAPASFAYTIRLNCGPPNYTGPGCANVTNNVVQYLQKNIDGLAGVTGANNVITDNVSNLRVMRLTDRRWDSSHSGSSFLMGIGGSANQCTINVNSTLVSPARNAGGAYVASFSVSTMQGTQTYRFPDAVGTVCWSRINPYWLYANCNWNGSACTNSTSQQSAIVRFDFTNNLTSPTQTLVHEFFNDGCWSSANLGGLNTVGWVSVFSISDNDKRFMFGFSTAGNNQGSGYWVAAWDRAFSGCRFWNTSTGTIYANGWGSAGSASYAAATFNIHETLGFLDGLHCEIQAQDNTCKGTNCNNFKCQGGTNAGAACTANSQCNSNSCSGISNDSPFIWTVDSNTVTAASFPGHYSVGYNNEIFGTQTWQSDLTILPVGNTYPAGSHHLIPRANLMGTSCTVAGVHASWQNDNGFDTNPVFYIPTHNGGFQATDPTLATKTNFLCNGYPIVTNPFNGPRESEIFAEPTAAPNSNNNFAIRFWKTYNSNNSPWFNAAETIGMPSPDGQVACWTSDGLGNFGNSLSQSGCVLGGPTWQATHQYNTGDPITPVLVNGSNYSYHAQSSCTSGTSAPTWTNGSLTEASGTPCVWIYDGSQSCMSDVLCGATAPSQIPATYFGIHVNGDIASWPASMPGFTSFGTLRLWDTDSSMPAQWATMAVTGGSSPTFDFSKFDTFLQLVKTLENSTGRPGQVIINLGRSPSSLHGVNITPYFSGNDGGICGYQLSGGSGQCFPPVDIVTTQSCWGTSSAANTCNYDSGGPNANWRSWVTALANNITSLSPAQYETSNLIFETWNELESAGQWYAAGTAGDAQVSRLTADAAAILTAANPSWKVSTFNTVNWDPSSIASTHGVTADMATLMGLNAINRAVNAITFHGYTTNAGVPEEVARIAGDPTYGMNTSVSGAGVRYPVYDTEFGWGTGANTFTDPDMQKAFVARSYLLNWNYGVKTLVWYGWDVGGSGASKENLWSTTNDGTNCTTPRGSGFLCAAGIAYEQVFNWMVGNTMGTVTGPGFPTGGAAMPTGVWQVPFTRPDGSLALAVWDSSQTCSGGSCTTSTFNVPTTSPPYTGYYTVDSGSRNALSGSTIPIGAKPILLDAPASNFPNPPTGLQGVVQ
jgi:hypothetical protein